MTVRDGNYQDRIIEDAPTFYWRLDNDYTDAMGNAEVGVAVTGVFSTPKYGTASAEMVFGVGGYINIPHHASMMMGTTQDFSVEFWTKKTATGAGLNFVDHRDTFSTGWAVTHLTTDESSVIINGNTFSSTTKIPEDGSFHHIVYVIDRDSAITIYMDNTPIVIAASTTTAHNLNNSSQITIGGRSYTQPSNIISGSIDEVAVYRRALTAADVDRHYKAGNKKYSGNVARIDTVGFDIDIAEQMFGLSDAPIQIKRINFYDPTAGDKAVLRDKAGNIVAELLCLTTNDDVELKFEDETLRCQGLKLLAADNTQTTGHLIITFA